LLLKAFPASTVSAYEKARNMREEKEEAEACQECGYTQILSLRTLSALVCA